jgi:hypothetical protein
MPPLASSLSPASPEFRAGMTTTAMKTATVRLPRHATLHEIGAGASEIRRMPIGQEMIARGV